MQFQNRSTALPLDTFWILITEEYPENARRDLIVFVKF
jgi:hypothetical protein